MTPEQQRIAIAEACGWTDCRPVASRMDDKPWISGYNPRPVKSVSCFTVGGESIIPPIACRESLPNYLSDLNAMHEAIEMLGIVQKYEFAKWLDHVVNGKRKWNSEIYFGQVFNCVHATATQRAEAFLRTLNLWTDTVPDETNENKNKT